MVVLFSSHHEQRRKKSPCICANRKILISLRMRSLIIIPSCLHREFVDPDNFYSENNVLCKCETESKVMIQVFTKSSTYKVRFVLCLARMLICHCLKLKAKFSWWILRSWDFKVLIIHQCVQNHCVRTVSFCWHLHVAAFYIIRTCNIFRFL